jgi:hypothetical protein
MSDMTLQFSCPAFTVHELRINSEHSTDEIRYVLLTYAHGGYMLNVFQTGRPEKVHVGTDVNKFDIKKYL